MKYNDLKPQVTPYKVISSSYKLLCMKMLDSVVVGLGEAITPKVNHAV
jgi:hypothetical protein